MNIFVDGKFCKGTFEIENGFFKKVTVIGEEDEQDREYVLPGLVEVHSHGREGEDFSFITEESIEKLLISYAKAGVTSVIGTTMTNERSVVETSVSAMGRAVNNPSQKGARLLGIHMEGPFLGHKKKGAHDEKYLSEFDKNWLDNMIERSHNTVRILSVDPCLHGACEFISEYTEKGIVLSLAHTEADYETACAAALHGADHVTHLFNAMEPLLHRAPGLIGAAFDNKMYQEIICDGIHVNPVLIRMWFKLNSDRMVLISDSMQAAGLPDGKYSLGGLSVYVNNGKATLEDGTIAGSTTDLLKEIRNAVSFGIPREQAVLAATLNPALSAGISGKVGSIKEGLYGDYIVTDKDFNLLKVVINGNEI